MASLTISQFGAPLGGLTIVGGTRVGIAKLLPPFAVGRAVAPAGYGVCWGWTPGGLATVGCAGDQIASNEKASEYLFNAVPFTAPSLGTLRLYGMPTVLPVAASVEVELIFVNDSLICPSDDYLLSQYFGEGMFSNTPLGAKSFEAPVRSMWQVFEAPVAYTWTPSADGILAITPSIVGVSSLINAALGVWHISL